MKTALLSSLMLCVACDYPIKKMHVPNALDVTRSCDEIIELQMSINFQIEVLFHQHKREDQVVGNGNGVVSVCMNKVEVNKNDSDWQASCMIGVGSFVLPANICMSGYVPAGSLLGLNGKEFSKAWTVCGEIEAEKEFVLDLFYLCF